ncbi:MAG TPA: DinB family protein, partial [Chthonomonadaceae bacterium]|nr:DinB family protein [Chthonomonadaceae bacterium]
LTLPLLSGGKARTQEEFDFASVPAPDDWPGLVAWLQQIGAEWNAALTRLPEAAFDTPTEWEGMTLTLARIITEMVEHDIQHAAQIEFLRWRWHAEAGRQ